jgi:hypothetical protein
MTKKKVSEVNKAEDTKLQAFIDAIKALEEEHGYQVVPMIQYTDQGLYPTVGTRKTPEKKETK